VGERGLAVVNRRLAMVRRRLVRVTALRALLVQCTLHGFTVMKIIHFARYLIPCASHSLLEACKVGVGH
jgi:hypothetical protein